MESSLLFLPGLLCDAALWQYQIKALEGDFNANVADLTVDNSIPGLARAALAKAPPKFTLIALSMGGYVAFEILRQAPERVERVAFMDTSARPDTPDQRRRRKGLIELSRKGDFKGVTPRLLPMLISTDHLNDDSITKIIMEMAVRVGQEAFIRQQTAIMERIDSRPHLKDVHVPALVLCGDEDALTPPEHAKEIAEGIGRHAELHIIQGSGHLTPLEQPKKVNTLLQNWLKA